MKIYFFLLLLHFGLAEYFDPTSTERDRFIALHATNEWGKLLRNQKSVRILVIGGSNALGVGCMENSFVDILRKLLENIDNSSYIINASRGGADISHFIGESFIFETESWENNRWPNAILIESAINSLQSWTTAQNIDNLLFVIFERYYAKKVPRPDILFLELFNVLRIVQSFADKNDTREERIRHLNSFSAIPYQAESFNRGCRAGPYINALAQFYSYPVLSAVNALWPSFTRFFIENKVISYYLQMDRQKYKGERIVWPYTFEGIHLSCKGHKFVGKDILIRFFIDQLKPRATDNITSVQTNPNDDIRMFSPSTYLKLVSKWTSWGNSINQFPFITEQTAGWNLTFVDHGNHRIHTGHDCYGARGATKMKAVFKIPTPRYCETCKIGISYVHSWNRSYFGNISCSLYPLSATSSSKDNETILIYSSIHSGEEVTNTAPIETRFKTSLPSGIHQVECTKLDDKFACFATIAVYLK